MCLHNCKEGFGEKAQKNPLKKRRVLLAVIRGFWVKNTVIKYRDISSQIIFLSNRGSQVKGYWRTLRIFKGGCYKVKATYLKSKKKITFLVILIILSFATFSNVVLADTAIFSDVKEGCLGKESIEKLSNLGIIKGYPDKNFRPDNAIRTNEFVTLIFRILKVKWPVSQVFSLDYQTEAADKNWAQKAIELANRTSMIQEKEFENYAQPLTRGQLTRIVSRAICIIDDPAFNTREIPEFSYDIGAYKQYIGDFDKLGELKEYVLAVFAKGLIDVYPDCEFKANQYVSRAEATVILSKLIYKEERINLEIQRYINTYPLKQKILWKNGITNFVVSYRSKGSMLPVEATLKVSREDGFKYTAVNYIENKTLEQVSSMVTEDELKRIFEYIINDNYFFVLPSNIGTDAFAFDGGTSSVTITLDGKEHSAGGYIAENYYYKNIVNKLFELKNKYISD